jgi:murein DD-endopeptidase MepM/ murein hydrolase activator NlpD
MFLSYILLGAVVLCVVVPGALLLMEYQYMKKAAQELLELKEDYRSYSMTLKRLVRENAKENGVESSVDDVKKNSKVDSFFEGAQIVSSDDDVSEEFFVVNREPDYLRTSALTFAKQYQLDQVLSKMFDTDSWEDLPTVKLFPTKKKKKKRQTTISGIPARARLIAEAQHAGKRDFLFSWPVERSKFWFSSPFGPRKIGKNKWKFHYGVDLAALRGTPIRAAAAGIVIQSDWHKGYGNCITIVHNRKYKTRYAHLHTRRVKVGQKVQRGGLIGTVGATGFVKKVGKDASHLHFEVYAFGRHVNPISVLV